MKVIAYAAGQDGSAEYRIKMPAAALGAAGYDVKVGAPAEILNAEEASLIVIQRPINKQVPEVIRECQRMGIAVVVDMDDNFDSLDKDHSFQISDEQKATIHTCCEMADAVTVTTAKLNEIYGHGHGTVIPNYIPETMLIAKPLYTHEEFWVGWTGTVKSHPHDLQVMGNGLKRALTDSPNAKLAVIGAAEGVRKATGVTEGALLGWAQFGDYPGAYASFDAALVPLNQTVFNDSKSWLKGLEAAAVGVPFIASPTTDYKRLVDLGAGVLAKYPADWRRLINELAGSPDLCADMAGRGREVAAKLTIGQHADEYWEVWTQALLNRRANDKVDA